MTSPTSARHRPVVLSVAGSDSSGGAGVQGDLLTLTALGVHGACVVTAVTAQGSDGVHGWWPVPPEAVDAQLDAVLGSLDVAVVKTGMLGAAATASAVARRLGRVTLPLVVDPVCVSTSGHPLLDAAAFRVLRDELLPLAALVTPNLAEVERLTGTRVESVADLERAAVAVLALGPAAVLVTGGHLPGDPVDLLHDGREFWWLPGTRHDNPHTHGSGCALSAAVAAYLASGRTLATAVRLAHAHVGGAVAHGYPLGSGVGPVDHVWATRAR